MSILKLDLVLVLGLEQEQEPDLVGRKGRGEIAGAKPVLCLNCMIPYLKKRV